MSDALARPPGTLATAPVTPLQLADFRRDPRTLYGKCFIQLVLDPDNNDTAEDTGRDALQMGPSNELFFRIEGVAYGKGGDVVKVLFEG
jgi:hypothetical protein